MKKIASMAFLVLFLTHCAALEQQYRENTCNYDGAYKLGMNDARSNKPMGNGISTLCDSAAKAETEKGYRDGYEKGLDLSRDQSTKVNIVEVNGTRPWPTIPYAKKDCISAYGKQECGYGCKSAYGEIKCGSKPGMSCLSAYGKIECGYHCKEEFGDIRCSNTP